MESLLRQIDERLRRIEERLAPPDPAATGIDPEKLYSPKEVAELAHISRSAVYKHLRGRLPVVKTGTAKLLIRGADLLAFLEDRTAL